MKKLSIEEKARRYDEAIEMAKEFKEHLLEINEKDYADEMDYIFPELAESEDEKIRKDVKRAISVALDYSYFDKETANNCLAWLEKQGEKPQGKSALEAAKEEKVDNQNCVNPADNAEPKFKNGQWIVWQDKCYKVNYNGCGYELIDQDGLSTSLEYGTVEESAYLWDVVSDAKNGDVLQLGVVTAIFQKYIGYGNCKCYCSVYNGEFEIPSQDGADNSYGCYDAIPATKEQRDTLMKAMTDAGYTFDFKKKELKKIDNVTLTTWSKDDEKIALSIEQIMNCASLLNIVPGKVDKIRTWLKSLKERYTWRPSDEQMLALEGKLTMPPQSPAMTSALIELYEQLKKL